MTRQCPFERNRSLFQTSIQPLIFRSGPVVHYSIAQPFIHDAHDTVQCLPFEAILQLCLTSPRAEQSLSLSLPRACHDSCQLPGTSLPTSTFPQHSAPVEEEGPLRSRSNGWRNPSRHPPRGEPRLHSKTQLPSRLGQAAPAGWLTLLDTARWHLASERACALAMR